MLTRHLNLFASLNRAGIEYLLVGGVPAIAYGVPRTTQDIDILIRPTLANAKKFLSVLKKLKLGTAYLTTPQDIVEHEVTLFKDVIRIDALTRLKSFTFEDVYPRRSTIEVRGILIPALSLEDLLVEKKSTRRPKDMDDIKVLSAISKRRRNGR